MILHLVSNVCKQHSSDDAWDSAVLTLCGRLLHEELNLVMVFNMDIKQELWLSFRPGYCNEFYLFVNEKCVKLRTSM